VKILTNKKGNVNSGRVHILKCVLLFCIQYLIGQQVVPGMKCEDARTYLPHYTFIFCTLCMSYFMSYKHFLNERFNRILLSMDMLMYAVCIFIIVHWMVKKGSAFT